MNFYIVDCFAEEKYQGNQLAVFIPDYDMSSAEMQQIAQEIHFSETAFILSGRQENGGYAVRIFTPDTELAFAGHPTLGTAYVIHQIMERGRPDTIILNLKAGPIPVSVRENYLTMVQNAPVFGQTADKNKIAEILRIHPDDILTDYPVQLVSTGLPCFVIPLKDCDAVKRCVIRHDRYQDFIDHIYKCGLLVFTPEKENKLKVRLFMDDPGFLEDPATGSANGNLAGYLLKYNFFHNNRLKYQVSQGSELGRPSTLYVSAELSGGTYHICVGGKVQWVARGAW